MLESSRTTRAPVAITTRTFAAARLCTSFVVTASATRFEDGFFGPDTATARGAVATRELLFARKAECGSSLFGGTWPTGAEVSIRLGTVDGDPGVRPQYHTFVGSKAAWDEILDDLPQYDDPLP